MRMGGSVANCLDKLRSELRGPLTWFRHGDRENNAHASCPRLACSDGAVADRVIPVTSISVRFYPRLVVRPVEGLQISAQ